MAFAPSDNALVGVDLDENRLSRSPKSGRARMIEPVPQPGPGSRPANLGHLDVILRRLVPDRRANDDRLHLRDPNRRTARREEPIHQCRGQGCCRGLQKAPTVHLFAVRDFAGPPSLRP